MRVQPRGRVADRHGRHAVGECAPSHLLPRQRLERVPCWRKPVGDALPDLFLPTRQPDAWTVGAPARILAESVTVWTVVLMGRLWPDDPQCWNLTVETDDWYAPAYVDLVINHQEQVWLLHLGITD